MSNLAPLTLADDERLRVQGVADLAARGEPAVDSLLPLLDDRSWAVRRDVIAALASIDAAVPKLCALLATQRGDENRVAAVVESLVASRGEVDEAVLRLADSSLPAVVCDAAQILGRRLSAVAVAKLAALAAAPDDNVAVAAVEALGRIGGEAAVAPLVAAVERRSFTRTFAAIEMLGGTRSVRGVPCLVTLLDDPLYGVEAARALGRIGDASALAPLSALLAAPADAAVASAAVAVREILDTSEHRFGTTPPVPATLADDTARVAVQRLSHCLEGVPGTDRRALIRVLGWAGDARAVPMLITMLSSDRAAAADAASALGKMGRAAEGPLVEALHDGSSEVRAAILPVLGHRTEMAAAIADCLTDADPWVRAAACDALARTGDPRVVSRIFPLLGDADAQAVQSAVAAIQSLGSVETESMALAAARSDDVRVRRAALRILGYFGYPSSIEVLLGAVKDADVRCREAAMSGLAYVEDPRGVLALVDAARDAAPRTRAAAMRALGRAQATADAIASLRVGLGDADEWVRYFACQALGRLKDLDAADAITALLEDPAGQVRVAVVDALALVRGVRAMDALHRAAASRDIEVKRAAVVGLGHVKDPSSVEILRDALAGSDPATRLLAVSALAEYELPLVARDLDGALSDPDATVRAATVALLAVRPGPEAARLLVARLTDTSLQDAIVGAMTKPVAGRVAVLSGALGTATSATAPLIVSILARMQTADATSALEEAFRSSDATIRRAVAPALATMRTSASRSLLTRAAAEDPDEGVRAVGAAAAATG